MKTLDNLNTKLSEEYERVFQSVNVCIGTNMYQLHGRYTMRKANGLLKKRLTRVLVKELSNKSRYQMQLMVINLLTKPYSL